MIQYFNYLKYDKRTIYLFFIIYMKKILIQNQHKICTIVKLKNLAGKTHGNTDFICEWNSYKDEHCIHIHWSVYLIWLHSITII